MKKDRDVPQHLLPEYDDAVDDAFDLAEGRLSHEREKAVRDRMAADPNYRAAIEDILDAESAPPLPAAVVEESLRAFHRRAGLVDDAEPEAELEDFAERVKARESRWRQRLYMAAAAGLVFVAALVGVNVWAYAAWTRIETASTVTSVVNLPDGSVVQLNPSSYLAYFDDMKNRRGNLKRDVDFRGSATFTVSTIDGAPFSVLTPSALITVVGTRFTVNATEDLTLIQVFEGQVRVLPLKDETQAGEPVLLGPGSSARVLGGKVVVDQQATQPVAKP